MRNVCSKTLALAFTLLGLASTAITSHAQTIETLIQFTNLWRYEASGANLGTAWRAFSYPAESAWPQGRAMIGYEPDAASIVNYNNVIGITPTSTPFNTPLPALTTVTTLYFRASFNFSGNTNGVSLITSNLVDDSLVIHLNGAEVGRLRVPANQTATTQASGGPATEGLNEPIVLSNGAGNLRQGANVLAVEVHGAVSGSFDSAFGLKLVAIRPTQLAITNQPDSQAVTAGEPVTFIVGVSGGPVTYRWFKDNVLQSSTSNELRIASAQTASAGNYHVVVSNILGAVTSTIATLTVASDTDGPIMLRAIINNIPAGGGSSFGSNTVNVLFDEPLNATTARNTNNYRLVFCTNYNIQVPILSVLYSTALGALINVDGSNANWNPANCYHLIVNDVADTRGNLIAPNSVIGVSILITTNLTQMSETWYFYDFNFLDPNGINIYTNTSNPWYGTNYVIDNNWGAGEGILYFDPNAQAQTCSGDTLTRLISFQVEPTLFRRTFNMPGGLGTNGSFRLRYLVDDGMVVYMNNNEIHRYNMPAGPLTHLSRAITTFNPVVCVTNVTVPVSNLRPNSNVLAAAVYQANPPENDTVFGLEMDAVFVQTPLLPPPARLTISRQACTFRVSWPTNLVGYTLQTKTNLNPSAAWVQVANQTNPYTNANACVGTRYYRLFRP